ncbi:hypothetical protein BSKO_00330 [Bryopsis sp. KO-2023]|nr:hypothetical protein BSKO_00330 [Bryopsis sp. KO-2023]
MGGIRRPSGCISHVVQVAARKQIPEILLRARFAVQIGGASFSWCVVWSLRELGKRLVLSLGLGGVRSDRNVTEEVRTIAQRAWEEHRAGNSQGWVGYQIV